MLLKLLALPVTAPLAGFRFCLDQLVDMAEQELLDDAPVREALLLLTLQLEEGRIDEEEYVAQEALLMRRLREIRAQKEQRARAAAGIPLAADPQQPSVVTMEGASLVVEVHDGLAAPAEHQDAASGPAAG